MKSEQKKMKKTRSNPADVESRLARKEKKKKLLKKINKDQEKETQVTNAKEKVKKKKLKKLKMIPTKIRKENPHKELSPTAMKTVSAVNNGNVSDDDEFCNAPSAEEITPKSELKKKKRKLMQKEQLEQAQTLVPKTEQKVRKKKHKVTATKLCKDKVSKGFASIKKVSTGTNEHDCGTDEDENGEAIISKQLTVINKALHDNIDTNIESENVENGNVDADGSMQLIKQILTMIKKEENKAGMNKKKRSLIRKRLLMQLLEYLDDDDADDGGDDDKSVVKGKKRKVGKKSSPLGAKNVKVEEQDAVVKGKKRKAEKESSPLKVKHVKVEEQEDGVVKKKVCKSCKQQGHSKKKCPYNPKELCKRCNKYGHGHKDCTTPNITICENCYEVGHVMKDCHEPLALKFRKCDGNEEIHKSARSVGLGGIFGDYIK